MQGKHSNRQPKYRTSLMTLQAAVQCADDMLNAGDDIYSHHDVPSLRLAFAAAICSANTPLIRNGWQVSAFRAYMAAHDGHLPTDVDVIKRITKHAGYKASIGTCKSIIALETMAENGELDRFATMPRTAREWLQWRLDVKAAVRGLAMKTTSMAALLLWPFDCPLVPVDRHVVTWLAYHGKFTTLGMTAAEVYGNIGKNTVRGRALYRQCERLVGNAKLLAHVNVSTAIYHWYRWSDWRQFTGAETPSETAESHVELSPYMYA